MESCAAGHQNTYCYSADSREVAPAHDHGMSCGKYRAFLELQKLFPDITPEEIQDMTMREIRDLAEELPEEAEEHLHHHGRAWTGGSGPGSPSQAGNGKEQPGGAGVGAEDGEEPETWEGEHSRHGHHGRGSGNGGRKGHGHEQPDSPRGPRRGDR